MIWENFTTLRGLLSANIVLLVQRLQLFRLLVQDLTFCGKDNDGNNQFQHPYFNLDAPYLLL